MKKIIPFALLLSCIFSCQKDEAIKGDACFSIIGDQLVVTNFTSETIHYYIAEKSTKYVVDIIPLDCGHFELLDRNKTRAYKVKSFFREEENPLSLTLWQCRGNRVVNVTNTTLHADKYEHFCTRLK